MFKRIEDFEFFGINDSLLKLDDVLASPVPYEYGLLKCIDNGGIQPVYTVVEYLDRSRTKPIKIEGMERYNEVLWNTCLRLANHFCHVGPVSCHMFLSAKDSISFPLHQDTEDVIIYMVHGYKTFEFIDDSIDLKSGDCIFIPRGTWHRAVNTDSSIMLSFGLERYLEDKCEHP